MRDSKTSLMEKSGAGKGEESVPKGFILLCKLACFTGVFPVKGIGGPEGLKSFSFKILSIPVIFSFIFGLFIKQIIVLIVSDPLLSAVNQGNSSEGGTALQWTFTDMATTYLGLLIIHSFGLFAHVLLIIKASKFVDLAKLLFSYPQKYPPKKGIFKTRLLNTWTVVGALCSIISIVYMTCWAYVTYSKRYQTTPQIISYFLGGNQPHPLISVLIYFLSFLVLEYGTFFLYIQIQYPAYAMMKYLKEIISNVEENEKNPDFQTLTNTAKNKKVTSLAWTILNNEFQETRNSVSFSKLCSQYIELEKIFQKYEECVGIYLIATLAYSVATAVCMIYVSTLSTILWPNFLLRVLVIQGTIAMAFFRINGLTGIGEEFRRRHALLVKTAVMKSQKNSGNDDYLEEIKTFISLVEALPLKLSAEGYFNVSKKNVTSIINVIITYFIVLQQFKMSET